ncbi:hypothetical protein HPC62_10660 [Thermoleptolyngbya sichuanensis A183]|uniref:Uncharacterized protein n=1 Tax=Thermoleptolyngbya sichuanensis A183 TaxID=2737172 RepID=A0A6M8B8V7_9CYAN|nr:MULTISPECIES: hypothetical protein [Thermoleptolyngbya]QKD82582.1 hypothetical protein HPC62_10660 [Thermoleptolyngbya sichuanensis A183]
MKKTLITLAISLISLLGPLNMTATAQVVINGQLVQGQELALLEYLMGTRIPAGRYWLDQNGNWGYEGNPVIQGNIFASQYGNPQPSNSNRSGSSTHYDPSDGSYMIRGSNGCTIVSTPSGSISSC